MKAYYFGCIRKSGHYMFKPRENYNAIDEKFLDSNPWGYSVDEKLCPEGPQTEGIALVHYKDGWTALSFWDRSVDKRGGCNSNFLAEGTFSFEEMLAIAREKFPNVMKRFSFKIINANEKS